MTRTIVAVLALVSVSGCAFVPFRHRHEVAKARHETPASAPEAPAEVAAVNAPAEGGCKVDLLEVLEGRPGSAVLAAEALELSGARSIRWMHPGDVVTMDVRPDRLNIKLTRANAVKSFACG